VRFVGTNGRNRTTKVSVTQKSTSNAQRGAVTGKIAIVFPAGSICNFTNNALNRRDAGYNDLVKALTGLTIGGFTNGTFGGELVWAWPASGQPSGARCGLHWHVRGHWGPRVGGDGSHAHASSFRRPLLPHSIALRSVRRRLRRHLQHQEGQHHFFIFHQQQPG
jgi:hypothetical protein